MKKKVLYLLLGIAAIILGILCIIRPELTALLCGIGLFIYGIGEIFHWRERRKAGAASIWALLGAVIPFAFGLLILLGTQTGEFAALFLLLCVSIWLMAQGVMEIIGAVMYRKAMTSVDLGVQAPGSIASFVLGIVMTACGVLGVISPAFAEITVWLWIVLELFITGVRLIRMYGSTGVLDENT